MATLTAERLREVLSYEPATGIFTWQKQLAPRGKVGTVAGCVVKKGKNNSPRLVIRIDGVLHLAHRLAWLYMTGEWPSDLLDHANCNPLDNRWGNLREADASQNAWNSSLRSNNTSGHKGVSWDSDRRKWQAHLMVNRKNVLLKRFERREDAIEAYAEAAARYCGEFARVA